MTSSDASDATPARAGDPLGVWSGGASGPATTVAGLALVVAGIVMTLTLAAAPWAGLVLVAVGLVVVVTAGRLAAEVTPRAFVVRFGLLGLPRRSVRWRDVADVSLVDVDPVAWGGWGYRWIPWKHATAAVVRKGEGIALVLRDGRRLVVTVDDAGGAVGAARRQVAAASR